MPTEEELRTRTNKKEYALPGEDGTLSNQKRQDRQVQEEGETHTAYDGDVVDGEKDVQNTNSSHPRFKPVLIGINIRDTSGRRQYELVPREEISPSLNPFLKEIENEKSSPPAKEETLRIFQKIVTHPESVCSVFQVNNVTYVFILVECSPEDGSFAASVQGHDKVLALIYDATNKRFVLVLFGDIKDSTEWKQEIQSTVYDIIFFIYGRGHKPAITDFPSNFPFLEILTALNEDATKAMLRDGDIRTRIAVAAKQDKLYKRPPVDFGNLSITDANSQQGQQQQPQQEGQQLSQQGQQQQPQQEGQQLSQQGQQQQPQQSSRPNAKEATEHQVQLELMEDEATTEQSLNNRKQKFGESETISDEQTVRDMLGSINLT